MNSYNLLLRAVSWLTATFLIAAIFPVWPYDFYIALRVLVTLAAIILFFSLRQEFYRLRIALILAALIFNPFVPIHLSRVAWLPLDIVSAGLFFLIGMYVDRVKESSNMEVPCPECGSRTTLVKHDLHGSFYACLGSGCSYSFYCEEPGANHIKK